MTNRALRTLFIREKWRCDNIEFHANENPNSL
jgi:hypothetical protein